jgi:hypothetical protein
MPGLTANDTVIYTLLAAPGGWLLMVLLVPTGGKVHGTGLLDGYADADEYYCDGGAHSRTIRPREEFEAHVSCASAFPLLLCLDRSILVIFTSFLH